MRSARAGYFRGGEAAAKPLPPLRERIAPSLKGLAELDSLQRELDREYTVPNKRTGRTMEPEEYFYLAQLLQARRDKLQATEDRALGIRKQVVQEVTVERSLPVFTWPEWSLSPFQNKLLILVFVLVCLFLQTHA